MANKITTINELANRRQYFRVKDKSSIEIAILSGSETVAEHFKLKPEFGLIADFQLLDVESKHLLRAVTDKDKNLGQFLKVLNQKLDSLARVLAFSQQVVPPESILDINLSEGGVSLAYPQKLNEDQRLGIKLILLPNYSGFLMEGRILSCIGDQAPYELHIAFEDITEAHQQLFARHIIKVQSHKNSPDSSFRTIISLHLPVT